MAGIYHDKHIVYFEKFSRQTVQAYAYFLALAMLYLFFNKQGDLSRLFLISVLISFAISLLVNRFLHLALHYFFQSKNQMVRKVMIIGYNDRAKKLAEYLHQQPIKTDIVGYCEEEENVRELTNYPIIGNINDVIEISKQYKVTEIFSTIAPEQEAGIYKLMSQADQACIRFRIIPDLNHFIRKPVHIDYLNDMPVLSLRKEPLDDVGNRIKKRFYDIAISSLFILLVLSWLVPIVALLIWLDSRGPVFFVQQRSGKGGKPFNCIKFRSMKVNRDANEKQATKNDTRITKLGRFLRKSNLDEMPQFFNVFMSDMSIVGPRPHMIKHTDDYSKMLNHYMIRHFLKPGITGWAQIHGFRGEIKYMGDINNRVEYDLWYLENWSLWLDTRIIAMTAFNMAKGEKNAY
jgi:putative colanic acid biosynthesis UDP-glucose lipid carrier transferase